MRAHVTPDAAVWLSDPATCALLARDRTTTNVPATRAHGIVEGGRPPAPDEVWLTVTDGDDVVGVAAHDPVTGLFVSAMPAAAADVLADAVAWCVPGEARGEVGTLRRVLGRLGRAGTLLEEERFLRLAPPAFTPPGHSEGRGRPAGPGDLDLLVAWAGAFVAEAVPGEVPAPAALRPGTVARLAAGQWWLWEDPAGRTVAMAGLHASPFGLSRIGPVYVEPGARGRGFAAAVTALAVRAALARGDDGVVLYADAANPVSNHVYEALGFAFDHAGEVRRLDRS